MTTGLRWRGKPIFHGWWITLAGSLMNALSSGLYGTGFTVWFLPLSRDLNLSSTATSMVFSFSRLEGGVQGLLTGLCIDRWGPRVMMVIAVIMAAVGFLLLPLAKSYAMFMLIYVGVISIGIHAGFNQGTMAAVNRWFVRRRGTAFGVVSVGVSLGGAVITPIVGMIVLNWGWQQAATISGILLLVVALPLAAFMRNSPEEMGLLPDGDKPDEKDGVRRPARFVPVEGVDYTARQAFRTFSYWFLALAICFRIAIHTGVFVHIVPLMVWKGMDEATGAIMVAVISFSGMGTRLLMGMWGDRWSRRKVTSLAMMAGAGSLMLLLFAPGKLWIMVVFGIVFSITEGAAGVTWAMLGDYFGRRAFATLRGGVNLVVAVGAVTTPILSGRVFDTTQSYYWALIPFSALYVVTAVMFLFARRPRRRALPGAGVEGMRTPDIQGD